MADDVQQATPVAANGATMTQLTPAEIEVSRIIKEAKAEGSITAADLAEKLSVLDITPDETDAVYQRLIELGVDVVEDEAIVEDEEEEEEDLDEEDDLDEDEDEEDVDE